MILKWKHSHNHLGFKIIFTCLEAMVQVVSGKIIKRFEEKLRKYLRLGKLMKYLSGNKTGKGNPGGKKTDGQSQGNIKV